MNDFIGIASVVVSFYIAKKELSIGHKRKIAKQQLQSVYLPLFKILEPYLYKTPDKAFVERFLTAYDSIFSNHYELITPDLIDAVRLLRANTNNKNFYRIYELVCSCVEKTFEKNRKILLLPTRKISYKLNNDQYPKEIRQSISQILTYLTQPLMALLTLTAFTLTLKFILNIIKAVFNVQI